MKSFSSPSSSSNSSSSQRKLWKSTARRVQLAVKTSWTHAVAATTTTTTTTTPAAIPPSATTTNHPDDEENDHECMIIPCSTIDDALFSLYDHADDNRGNINAIASSYVPEIPSDWLLDGTLFQQKRQSEEEEQALKYLQLLSADPIPDIVAYIQQWEEQNNEERRQYEMLENWNAFPEDKNDAEDIDEENFGDFQTAEVSSDSIHIEHTPETNTVTVTSPHTPMIHPSSSSSSSSSSCSSPSFDDLDSPDMDEPVAATISAESSSTPILVARADEILAQYHSQTIPAILPSSSSSSFKGDDDSSTSSSVGTPDLMRYTDQFLTTTTTTMTITSVRNGDHPDAIDDYTKHEKCNNNNHNIEYSNQEEETIVTSQNDNQCIALDKDDVDTGIYQQDQHADEPETEHNTPLHSAAGVSFPPHWNEPEEEQSLPLSWRLPLDDLASPEARFVRRVQQQLERQPRRIEESTLESPATSSFEKWESQDLNRWPEYYFTSPDLDDTVSVLQSLPWHHLLGYSQTHSSNGHHNGSVSEPLRQDLDGKEDVFEFWDQHVTARLCELDASLRRIQNEILVRIHPHRTALERANALVHECEKNLRLAFLYHERSLEAIQQAKGSEVDATGLVGHTILVQAWTLRDEFTDLNDVLRKIDIAWQKEKDLIDRIDNFDLYHSNALEEYHTVMALTNEVMESISSNQLARLQCLGDMRTRLPSMGGRFWARMQRLANQMVASGCRKKQSFNWIEYERLVDAAIDLYAKAGVNQCHKKDLATSWTENLLLGFFFEADRALAAALLWPSNSVKSDFEAELRQMADEIDRHWGDCAKLKSISHNLITIRFDYEAKHNYLPQVYYRLCTHLVEILLLYVRMLQWHESQGEKICNGKAMFASLEMASQQIWDYCIGVVTKCLDEFLHFSARRELFIVTESGVDDSSWKAELENLHQIMQMTRKFLSLKQCFLKVEIDGPIDPFATTGLPADSSHLLLEKLSDVFRGHLRTVHVEAMNTIGRKLTGESWKLQEFSGAKVLESNASIQNSENFLRCCLDSYWQEPNPAVFAVDDFRGPFADISLRQDLFNFVCATANESESRCPMPESFRCSAIPENNASYDRVESVSHDSTANESVKLAPQTVTQELVLWLARLLATIKRLPLIAEDVSAIAANLCDLYFTTVLRLCAGSAKSERILLGEDPISSSCSLADDFASSLRDENSPGSPIFSSFRKNRRQSSFAKNSRSNLSSFLEAEICAPLPRDIGKIRKLNDFVKRAQLSLKDIVNLEMVESWIVESVSESPEEQASESARLLAKRQAAILGCFSVAGLVDALSDAASQFLASLPIPTISNYAALNSLRSYSRTVLDITPTLAQVTSQIACARALNAASIVSEIMKVGSGWEEAKLHEHANDYVEILTEKCALIWGFLAASANLPSEVMKSTWENIVQACYLSLLEGFARVPCCSTEGRALMKLDLASFAAGISPRSIEERLDNVLPVSKPPSVDPDRGMGHVDTFVKVFYYPKDDAMQWIAENYKNYHVNHALALANSIAASYAENYAESFNESAEYVKSIYLPGDKSS